MIRFRYTRPFCSKDLNFDSTVQQGAGIAGSSRYFSAQTGVIDEILTVGGTDQTTTTQFTHDLIAQMESPYGDLRGTVSFQRFNHVNELSAWNASIADGKLGPLKRFGASVGDTSVGFSDLTLPTTVEAEVLPSKFYEPGDVNNLVGDGIHNFVDGAAIAAAFTTDTRLGIVTTVAVAAHEIPSELSDFAVLIYAGFSNSRAIFFNLISALTAVLGALSVLLLSSKYLYLTDFLLPVAAGNFIYIAGTSLFPELHKRRNPTTTILETSLIVLGVVLIVLVKNSFE